MYKMITLIVAMTVGLLASTAMAQGQPQCKPRDNVLEYLAKKYQEAPVAMGITYQGGLVELLTTENGSTWTIIISTPDGLSCFVAGGEDWRTKKHISLDPNTISIIVPGG